ncbi:MAG TPA: gamma-glutamylcyclotransferase [Candidatus Hydrogenedentes bacterium]|nr:gamma-glutamylcyclotransferase [Candidatus Hydrogenedentota bacterium]HPG66462.1 gamma-glutamylcyclotransferase [Candidatus Hydrogenedentota bacterium]
MKPKDTPRKNTNRDDRSGPVIALFVYGTLKSGFPNHDRFCRNAIDIQPATVWGRLYDLGAYPALEVPEETILAYGTADPRADVATQAHYAAYVPAHAPHTQPSGDWDPVHGELIILPDPARALPPLDYLEGFRPGRSSLYQRVLVPIQCGLRTSPAWVYVMHGPFRGQLLSEGRWPR